jgi:hypothetical protein
VVARAHPETPAKWPDAWPFCHHGTAVAGVNSLVPAGVNVGVTCAALSAANNFMSGCTATTPPMTLNQATTSELWILSGSSEVEGIDSSIWQAFGGRSVRFIWRYE